MFFQEYACVFLSQLAKVDLHFANQICFSMLLGWPHEIGPSSVDAYGLHVDTLTNAERKQAAFPWGNARKLSSWNKEMQW